MRPIIVVLMLLTSVGCGDPGATAASGPATSAPATAPTTMPSPSPAPDPSPTPCQGRTMVFDYVADPRGHPTPEKAARQVLDESLAELTLHADDSGERVRVRSGGQVVAVAHLFRTSDGGYVVGQIRYTC